MLDAGADDSLQLLDGFSFCGCYFHAAALWLLRWGYSGFAF
jgi:hypothetical protein